MVIALSIAVQDVPAHVREVVLARVKVVVEPVKMLVLVDVRDIAMVWEETHKKCAQHSPVLFVMVYKIVKEMKKQKQYDDIQTRREFFKNASKKVLPLFAVSIIGSSLFTSCVDDLYGGSMGCGGCGNTCSGSCKTDCSGNCDAGCKGDCYTGCTDACWKYSYYGV